MKRIAIIGGGISGLTAAYELEKQRRNGASIDWQLFEATDRLGGIIQTTRRDGYILEGGPDGWVSEKPWARELAVELGLESELIYSNDATRKTYILIDGKLQPMPQRMRMMVPEDLAALEGSPLFSAEARAAYAAELAHAAELKASAPDHDESVASFVLRHFGQEVLDKVAAPLLSGVFGGDVAKLSVRSVMPAFVAMEREHGSLIAALQTKTATSGDQPQQPIFTSLRNGMGSLVDALVAKLPSERIHLTCPPKFIADSGADYEVVFGGSKFIWTPCYFADHLILALPLDQAREHVQMNPKVSDPLLPVQASSAILAAFIWPAETAGKFTVPPGFGFLVPPPSEAWYLDPGSSLLACTFVDQKFPHRTPPGARILRAFFGGASAERIADASDDAVAAAALTQLRAILGPMPDPPHTEVRRWPRSLPQYEVGHMERMAQLDEHIAKISRLTLLGNSYRGVGVPDLVREARSAARALAV
jgi:oxygen-dependent protoporphyrinogen oxidase